MILVTGGSGFVGAALVPILAASTERLCVLTRRPGGGSQSVELRTGDLLDAATLTTALRDVTTLIHLAAALPRVGVDFGIMRRINVDGTRNLAATAISAGVKRFIHVSSAGVYGDRGELQPANEQTTPTPQTAYERTKLDAEHVVTEACRNSSMSLVILRPTGIFGPGRDSTLHFYKQVAHRAVWIHGPSRVIVHPTYVGDLVQAILLTLTSPMSERTVFNIAGNESLDYRELIARIGRRIGVRTRQVRIPAQPTLAIAKAAMVAARAIGHSASSLERIQQRVINRSVDTSLARQVLGFTPSPLEDGIDVTIDWARRAGRL